MKNFIKQKGGLFFKGMVMGAADIIPGVSGGTMALILGVYAELIESIKNINVIHPFKSIKYSFFVPLGTGIVCAIIGFAHVIKNLMEAHTGVTYAFFFGLIAISAFYVLKEVKSKRYARIVIFIALGALMAYFFVGMNPIEGKHSLLITFFSAMVAISAMLLPGVSGSFLLLLLGQYEYIIGAIEGRMLDVIGIFILGAGLGALVFSRFLSWLLQRFRSQTMAFLVGVMMGALRLPFGKAASSGEPTYLLATFCVLGALIVFAFERYAGGKK